MVMVIVIVKFRESFYRKKSEWGMVDSARRTQ